MFNNLHIDDINLINSKLTIDIDSESATDCNSTISSVLNKYNHFAYREYFEITNNFQSKKYNKSLGKYSLINLPIADYSEFINYYQKLLLKELSMFYNDNYNNVLVVGLGNSSMLSDALGNLVCDKIICTSSDCDSDKHLSILRPSVKGLTGIESYDIILSVSQKIKPDLIIFIDSLCASEQNRLGNSFQITNSSITPGSGVNNSRKLIDKSVVGCDIIVIGVPYVIYSNTFIKSFINNKLNYICLSDYFISSTYNGNNNSNSHHIYNDKNNNDNKINYTLNNQQQNDVTFNIASSNYNKNISLNNNDMKNIISNIVFDNLDNNKNDIVTLSDIELNIDMASNMIANVINKLFYSKSK